MSSIHVSSLLAAIIAAAGVPCAHGAQIGIEGMRDSRSSNESTTDATMPALLINDELTADVVQLVGISGDAVIFFDPGGVRRSAKITGLTALLPTSASVDPAQGIGAVSSEAIERTPHSWTDEPYMGMLELVDGQILPGHIASLGEDAESVLWTHDVIGQIEVPLERISRMINGRTRFGAPTEFDAAPLVDEVTLSNGDLLTGFILSLDDPIEIESGNDVIRVPRDRVEEARFANPREPLRGLVVWLGDGTVAAVEQLQYSSGAGLSVMLSNGARGLYEPTALRSIAFGAESMVPLSELEPISQTPIGSHRRVVPISRRMHPDDRLVYGSSTILDAQDVYLPGPMEVVYELPDGAHRFAATAALVENSNPWGDCELIVLVDNREVWRSRLFSDEPVKELNVDVSGKQLTIRVDPGLYGPIMDRVLLHRPLLRVHDRGL